jgi:hypothetical protein
MGNFWEGAEIIDVYSRADALADGVLIDVSELAKQAGFKFPVAITQAAHEDCVAWDSSEKTPQDETGRLWDIFTMALYTIRKGVAGDTFLFRVLRVPMGGRRATYADLKMVIGPGDTPAPVMTIMLADED